MSVDGGNIKMFLLDDNIWERILIFWDCIYGNGDKNFKGFVEWFNLILEGRVIKLMVWGLRVEFIKFYGIMLGEVFRFESVWDG